MRTIAQAQTVFALLVEDLLTAVMIVGGQDYPPNKDDLAYLFKVAGYVQDAFYLREKEEKTNGKIK